MRIYCIDCEMKVFPEDTPLGLVHETVETIDTGTPYNVTEFYYCDFPLGWAACPPPYIDMDEFMDSVVEPDEDEMAAINAESVL